MFEKRIKSLQTKLKGKNLDSLLVSNFYNIYYLTGFAGLAPAEREAYVLVTHENLYLLTDGRYFGEVRYRQKKKGRLVIEVLRPKLITPEEGLVFHLDKIIKSENLRSIGFETEDLKFFEYQRLKKKLDVVLVAVERMVVKMREVKDENEIKAIRQAAEVADQCLKEIIKTIKIGQTEKEIVFRIEYWLKSNGYDIAFDPIVAVNQNSAIPHYNPKTGFGKVGKRAVILIDLGAKYRQYLSDITRMVFINPQRTDLALYDKLLEAQEKTTEEIGRVNNPREIDLFARNFLKKSRLPNYLHSTGHGVGLEIHEYPKISQMSTDILEDNQVFTIEPAVYLEGRFGMRIEDTVVVRRGRAEALTKFPKSPYII
jgi:Xaa-Pro aminopeptidase